MMPNPWFQFVTIFLALGLLVGSSHPDAFPVPVAIDLNAPVMSCHDLQQDAGLQSEASSSNGDANRHLWFVVAEKEVIEEAGADAGSHWIVVPALDHSCILSMQCMGRTFGRNLRRVASDANCFSGLAPPAPLAA